MTTRHHRFIDALRPARVHSSVRALAVAVTAVAAIGLAGCGGGVELSAEGLSVAVAIDGHPYGPPVAPGTPGDVNIHAGQSIALDATEPVTWTMVMGSTAAPADGTTWLYGGATLRATAVSASRVVLDTAAAGPLPAPVPIMLTARSTLDAALIAVVNVAVD